MVRCLEPSLIKSIIKGRSKERQLPDGLPPPAPTKAVVSQRGAQGLSPGPRAWGGAGGPQRRFLTAEARDPGPTSSPSGWSPEARPRPRPKVSSSDPAVRRPRLSTCSFPGVSEVWAGCGGGWCKFKAEATSKSGRGPPALRASLRAQEQKVCEGWKKGKGRGKVGCLREARQPGDRAAAKALPRHSGAGVGVGGPVPCKSESTVARIPVWQSGPLTTIVSAVGSSVSTRPWDF